MAEQKDDEGLPQVWPFTLGALLIVFGLVWFQLGFAVHDMGRSLWGHYSVFWALLIVGVVIIIAGGIWNTVQGRRRRMAH
jgi:hypothetical protein